jgi:hypothetical protein
MPVFSWECIGQYGRTIILSISGNTFPVNSALRRPIQPFSGSAVGTVGTIPGEGDTLSGSRVSDGEPVVRTSPGTPKYGEFRKNGTIRRFPGPYHAPTGILPAWKKIRANIRYWTGDLFSNGLWRAEMERRAVLGIGLTTVR